MLNCILEIPAVIIKYFKRFRKIFSKKMAKVFLYYITGLLLEYKRFNLSQLTSKSPEFSYQRYQYFLSEAKWDEKELNMERLKYLNSKKQTKSNKNGVLIIDDTSNKKSKNCKRTESVGRQYSTEEEGIVNSQVSVYSCWADIKKGWPVDFKPYWPEEAYFKCKDKKVEAKSKIELGMELIKEAIERGIKFSHVVYDSWYLSNEMIIFCQTKGIKFISELNESRWVLRGGKWIKGGELVKLAQERGLCLKPAKLVLKDSQRRCFYWEWEGKIKGIPFNLRFILTRFIEEDGKSSFKFLVTNDLKSPSEKIIQGYALRWSIEVMFRHLKDYFYLDQFQVRSVKAFSRHYYLCMLAYTFVLTHLMCGTFCRISAAPVKTFEEAIWVLRDLITIESFQKACKNVRLIIKNKNLRLKKLLA